MNSDRDFLHSDRPSRSQRLFAGCFWQQAYTFHPLHCITLQYTNKQTNKPLNSTLISLLVISMNPSGCVVEKMQHLKVGKRWSAYWTTLLHSWSWAEVYVFLHCWFRDVCRVCITGSETVMKRRDGLCFASTGLYTRFIFCSTYTQAYSKLSLPLHHDAFLPAKQSDLPVDSTTRLHAHRGTCSSAYQFFFSPSV